MKQFLWIILLFAVVFACALIYSVQSGLASSYAEAKGIQIPFLPSNEGKETESESSPRTVRVNEKDPLPKKAAPAIIASKSLVHEFRSDPKAQRKSAKKHLDELLYYRKPRLFPESGIRDPERREWRCRVHRF